MQTPSTMVRPTEYGEQASPSSDRPTGGRLKTLHVKLLHKKIIAEITKPSERDKQRLIGPSGIGGCPRCVGEELAAVLPEQYPDLMAHESFGLGAWIGTAVHAYIEATMSLPGAIKEQKNPIFELEGYGVIEGSTDMFLDGHVFDWKVLGKANFDKLRLLYKAEPNKIPTQTYRCQQHLYGLGWEKLGYKVETVNILAIPKLSNDPDDIRWYTEHYSREIALKFIDRLKKIWQHVRDGELELLPSDSDCYTCTRVLFRA